MDGKLVHWVVLIPFFLLWLCSTKDPGQQPFQFKIGMGKVIKGSSSLMPNVV